MSDIQEAVRNQKPTKAKSVEPKKGAAAVEQALLARTPDQILGPFYPLSLKPTTSGDLTKKGKAEGQVLYVTGRVLSTTGKPVEGAKIEIWQANSKGRYRHPNDDSDQPLDPNFKGFAVLTSGKDGSYQLKTIKPASYQTSPGNFRPAHLHFCITSKREQLTTQMYFEGDRYNDSDPFLQSARRKDALIVRLQDPIGKMEAGSKRVVFDIVLMKG
jgi:protocatechuate 3,4-dioxygenase, beta subunit